MTCERKESPFCSRRRGSCAIYPYACFSPDARIPLRFKQWLALPVWPNASKFLPARKDIEFYYAAADAYAGPSLEDTFALPPAEAMACGLPVIVSADNGTCEIISHGEDGMILNDATDAESLASVIRKICQDPAFRVHLGEKAAETARQYTWELNGHDLELIFEDVTRRKAQDSGHTLAQES